MIQIGRTSFKKVDGHDEVITENVVKVIEKLNDKFSSTVIKLRSDRLDQLKNVLENPASNPVDILFKDSKVDDFELDVPDQLFTPGIEISGPSSQTSMFINGLNENSDGFRADGDLDDNEDASGHTLEDTVRSAINRKGAVLRNLEYFDKNKNKKYSLNPGALPFFMHRERGILLDEKDYLIDGKPVIASILDTVLTLTVSYTHLTLPTKRIV